MPSSSRLLMGTGLRYFLEVVRCGSVSEASQRLSVAGSAISRQITRLEQELDTVLFERHPRGMVPSAAGELLAAHARRSQLDTERVADDIQALAGLRRGKVRLASSEGFAIDFLPGLIAAFREHYSGIQFDLHVNTAEQATRRVLEGDADIALTYSLAPRSGVHIAYRQSSPIHAIMAPDHPLADREQVSLAQMHPWPIALPETTTTLRQLFDVCCSRRQLLFEPVFTSNFTEALTSFALLGQGLTLSGELTVRRRLALGRLMAVPIRDPGMDARQIQIQTLAGRTLPRAVNTFLDFLRSAMEQPPGAVTLPTATA
ncbi:DNA-binding transcriptional LysR family regulator [Kushneria sinocarnis]|uniref:DNA-binding transcriptional LysR family regulator n=1 Tax=Kushneria sinocarnis TaxID=595502 RepID=A0A420X036_9GAMM|nr:LysR family transcriptional regulator [Kushneria sinocarnis]RKR06829.1 DNA-binding transcriptional LysR family regulator [Kushneria sinocarnis]